MLHILMILYKGSHKQSNYIVCQCLKCLEREEMSERESYI